MELIGFNWTKCILTLTSFCLVSLWAVNDSYRIKPRQKQRHCGDNNRVAGNTRILLGIYRLRVTELSPADECLCSQLQTYRHKHAVSFYSLKAFFLNVKVTNKMSRREEEVCWFVGALGEWLSVFVLSWEHQEIPQRTEEIHFFVPPSLCLWFSSQETQKKNVHTISASSTENLKCYITLNIKKNSETPSDMHHPYCVIWTQKWKWRLAPNCREINTSIIFKLCYAPYMFSAVTLNTVYFNI